MGQEKGIGDKESRDACSCVFMNGEDAHLLFLKKCGERFLLSA